MKLPILPLPLPLLILIVGVGRKTCSSAVAKKIPKIGIIGGGIGGTSCAYFLQSLFGENKVDIDVFEEQKVGGRLSVVDFSGRSYEEGGSIIHSRNRYLSEFLEEFNLSKRQNPDGYFALYNGKNFVFSESYWQLKTLWDVVYRYGFGFWKLKSYIDGMLNKFDRIYHLQSIGQTFETVNSLMSAMDSSFEDFLHISTKSGFENQGIPDIVINEIVMATIRANYGQNLKIQKMVGSVSVAGAVGNLWSVFGGNVQIPESLLNVSKATLISRLVVRVKKLASGQIEIVTGGIANSAEKVRRYAGTEEEDGAARIYDAVVVAAPQTSDMKNKIEFQGFDDEIKFSGRYHKTVCTLVEGRLSDKYFPSKDPLVDEILTTEEGLLFNSIGRISPVDYAPEKYNRSDVWKIFTGRKLKEKEISSLFSQVRNTYVREWLAYPHYDSKKAQRNESFVLAPNLYHINAIEWAASAMEMVAIGAKNVALLIYNKYMENDGDDDSDPGKSNDEL